MPLMDPYGVIGQLNGNYANLNRGYMVITDSDIYQIHVGKHYMATDYADDVDADVEKQWLIVTPDMDAHIHFHYEISTSGPALVRIYEGTEVTANGVQLQSYNRNRNKDGAAEMLAYSDPTVTDAGEPLVSTFLGTVSLVPTITAGGTIIRTKKIVLKSNTNYLLSATAISNDTRIAMILDWSEMKYREQIESGVED